LTLTLKLKANLQLKPSPHNKLTLKQKIDF